MTELGGEGEGKWEEGVYSFSSERVTIKSNNVYRGVEWGMCGPARPPTALRERHVASPVISHF